MRVRARGLHKLRPSALRESEQFAAQQEGALLADALLRSKIDMESGNEVVLLRLTSYSDEVHAALLESPELEACRAAVLEAGCDLVRSWGNGAKMFEEHFFWETRPRDPHTGNIRNGNVDELAEKRNPAAQTRPGRTYAVRGTGVAFLSLLLLLSEKPWQGKGVTQLRGAPWRSSKSISLILHPKAPSNL